MDNDVPIPADSELIVEAPIEDREFFLTLKADVPAVDIIEPERFAGLPEIIQVVVPLTASLVPIMVAYFSEKSEIAKARLFIKDGKKVRLAGYSPEEIERILKAEEAKLDDADFLYRRLPSTDTSRGVQVG
jgi:hypothetical protein